MGLMFFYNVFGLVLGSERELPELDPSSSSDYDVQVRWVNKSFEIEEPEDVGVDYRISRGSLIFTVTGVASFAVRNGTEIQVAPSVRGGSVPESDEAVRAYLLGSGLGAILHQRGVLPIHASSVITDRGAWLFCGDSGAGKSTLATKLVQKAGLTHFSDDIVSVDRTDERLLVCSGPPRIKLWSDALDYLGIPRDGLAKDIIRIDKFHIRPSSSPLKKHAALAGLVNLVFDDEMPPSVDQLKGVLALRCVLSSVYRPMIACVQFSPLDLLQQTASVAKSVPVLEYRRPRNLKKMSDSLDLLLNLLR